MAPSRRRHGSSAGVLGVNTRSSASYLDGRGANPWEFPGVVLAADSNSAAWLIDALDSRWVDSAPDETTVASIVPSRFEAYARILHPAPKHISDDGGLAPRPAVVAWAEVAAWSGRILHAGAQFHRVISRAPGLPDAITELGVDTPPGETPHEILGAIAAVLLPYTTTPRHCWFALWDGYGDLHLGDRESDGQSIARLRLPGRTYLLYSGPLSAATAFATHGSPHSPTLWWPKDCSWFVGSDPDLDSTYLGASSAAVEEVLADPRLESLWTRSDQSVTFDADDVNVDR